MRLALRVTVLIACLSTALPAAADCVTAAMLATGVAFSRANGEEGLVRRDGEAVRIDYRSSSAAGNRDERVGKFGIYETWTDSESTSPDPDGQ